MSLSDWLRLLLLAAIWGGSFVFLRVVSPALGPIVTADLRVLIAAVALLLYFRIIKLDLRWRQSWRHYGVIGTTNAAVPFSLFAFAALYIPASYSAILNATSPLFGALFAALWLGEKITIQKGAGFILGIIGVALVTRVGSGEVGPMALWAMAACLGAAFCYGIGGTYAKAFASGANPKAIAGASQLFASLVLLPLTPLMPPPGPVKLFVAINMIAFALLCSGWAFLLYFRLIADVGPTKALTVTFLMPAFTMLWAALFLGETVTVSMIIGCVLILGGTGVVVVRPS